MVKKKKRKKDFSFFKSQMKIKYFNTNFKNIANNSKIDQDIFTVIKNIKGNISKINEGALSRDKYTE